LNISLENTIEQYVTIDPKWHSKFFLNKRKLLSDLQKQFGDMLIKLPEKSKQSDQVLLRGPKQIVEQVQKRIEELVDTWENTVTQEISIPHRHYGYLLAQGGAYIQPIQKEFNVQIKFPPRNADQQHESTADDQVKITGRKDNVDKAIEALEKMIPVEVTFDIPYEVHGVLVGKKGSQLQALFEQYSEVQITFPPLNSTSNTIHLKGQADQVESVKKDLLERYEKYQADQQARSFQLQFTIKSTDRSLIFGPRQRTLINLQQKYEVNIQIGRGQTPPTESTDENQPDTSANNVEVTIVGYEDKAKACRDEILRLIKDFESTITMEIDIDHRIHARIIGSGGSKLQQIQKDYGVEVKFPSNNRSDQVHVIGKDQEKIDACIDHLLILEEDFLQDLPYSKQTELPISQEVSSSNNSVTIKPTTKTNKQHKQEPFRVRNAPWTSNDENAYQMKNGHQKSPRKAANAPNRNDLDEYPKFANGLSLTTDDNSSAIHETTGGTIPVIWGPQKRNK